MSRVWRLCPVFRAQPGAYPPKAQNRTLRRRAGALAENARIGKNGSGESRLRQTWEHAETGKIEGFWTPRRESGEKAGQSRGVVRIPRRSHLPAVRAVSGICEGVVERAKIALVGSQFEKSPPFQGKRRGSAEIVRRDSALLRDAGLGRVWAAGQHLLHLTPTQEHC